jgi:hypothetical protein
MDTPRGLPSQHNISTDALSDCDPTTLSFILDISPYSSKAEPEPHDTEEYTVVQYSQRSLPSRRKRSFEMPRENISSDHLTVLPPSAYGTRSFSPTSLTSPTGLTRKVSVARKPAPQVNEELLLAENGSNTNINNINLSSPVPNSASAFELSVDPPLARDSVYGRFPPAYSPSKRMSG